MFKGMLKQILEGSKQAVSSADSQQALLIESYQLGHFDCKMDYSARANPDSTIFVSQFNKPAFGGKTPQDVQA